MANRYANLVGSNKIKDEWQKINDGFAAVEADMDQKASAGELTDLQNTVSGHIGSGGDVHAEATESVAGFMSAADKIKLDGVEPGAQANQNAFAKINDVEASAPSDEFTIKSGVGITVTSNPIGKEVTITATGEATPGPHGSSHLEFGADPIPNATDAEGGLMSAEDKQALEALEELPGEVADLQQEVTEHLAETVTGVLNVVTGFGADPTGLTDTSSQIQAALDSAKSAGGGTVIVPEGIYLIAAMLVISTNTRLIGLGNVIFKAANSLPFNKDILINENFTTAVDKKIRIENIVFDGNNNPGRTTSLVALGSVSNFKIVDCYFQNTSYQGLQLAACKYGDILSCYYTKTGNPTVTAEGGAAIWMGAIVGVYNEHIKINNCIFEDMEWAGIYAIGNHIIIDNNSFENCKESSVFSNNTVYDIRVTNNTIKGVKRKYISSSGIELGSKKVLIQGNTIIECESNGVALTDVQDAIIADNIILNNGQDNVTYSTASGIAIISTVSNPNQPKNIKIHDNRIGDDQAVKTQVYGVSADGVGSAIEYVEIYDNNLYGNKTDAILIGAGKFGLGSYTANNIGHASSKPKLFQFQAPSATGNFSVTGVGFKGRTIELDGVLNSSVSNSHFHSYVDSGISLCKFGVTDGSGSRGGIDSKAIKLIDGAGNTVCEATLVSIDQDGFTLNFTTAAVRPWVNFIVHP